MSNDFIDRIKSGNFRELARAISLVENESKKGEEILRSIYKYTGKAYRLGVTGPPGAGKSTLVSRLVKNIRSNNDKVGIIAVDPTSPFSGGAVLGDRIRMTDLTSDPGVFIRSMATRGSLGGLSKTAQDVADLMDAAGMEIVIFETVGVGQGELDVARTTDTTVVVLVPESGDGIQAMKAGLMEIADIFVVNKADRDGAEKMKIELEMMLHMMSSNQNWTPPIVKTVASKGEGLRELHTSIWKHKDFIINEGVLVNKRTERAIEKIRNLAKLNFEKNFWTEKRNEVLKTDLHEVLDHKLSPYQLIDKLFKLK